MGVEVAALRHIWRFRKGSHGHLSIFGHCHTAIPAYAGIQFLFPAAIGMTGCRMFRTMETRLTTWIDRNLNGYTAGLGTAFGLAVGGYVAFGVLDIHILPRIIITYLGSVVGVLVAAAIATPFTRDRGKPTLL
ncbi:MAG: hypothetical protein F4X72_04365 [Dehalococcoidia bacterium]|nr:hypothetical protein [Dehalococcoidia bacterium]